MGDVAHAPSSCQHSSLLRPRSCLTLFCSLDCHRTTKGGQRQSAVIGEGQWTLSCSKMKSNLQRALQRPK
jgi:hypothetical protein